MSAHLAVQSTPYNTNRLPISRSYTDSIFEQNRMLDQNNNNTLQVPPSTLKTPSYEITAAPPPSPAVLPNTTTSPELEIPDEDTLEHVMVDIQACSHVAVKLGSLLDSITPPLREDVFEGIVLGFQEICRLLDDDINDCVHHFGESDSAQMDFTLQEFFSNMQATLKPLGSKANLFTSTKAIGIIDCCHLWSHALKQFKKLDHGQHPSLKDMLTPLVNELETTKRTFLQRV